MARTAGVCVDGNEARPASPTASARSSPIYPITPASPMGELADDWAPAGRPNLWGAVPEVVEMQSEAGAAGALHGALQKGALATTFTASQGLLLMVPNMFKIAGELTPARDPRRRPHRRHPRPVDLRRPLRRDGTPAPTGWAMLAAGTVQEAHDFAAVAHAATLRVPRAVPALLRRLPHLPRGGQDRGSSTTSDLRALVDDDAVLAHRARGPDARRARCCAARPRTPTCSSRPARRPTRSTTPCPASSQRCSTELAARTGRRYGLVDYVGAPDAERVVVLMGSGAGAAEEAVEALIAAGERVGLLTVRLYRPFPAARAPRRPAADRPVASPCSTAPRSRARPASRCYLDVVAALAEARQRPARRRAMPRVIGGRYGLSSKEFTPAMAKAVFDELAADAPREATFTVGIVDDVTHLSLDRRRRVPHRATRPARCRRCSSGSAPTARSGPTRRRSRSSASTPTCSPRATSSTTPRSPAR